MSKVKKHGEAASAQKGEVAAREVRRTESENPRGSFSGGEGGASEDGGGGGGEPERTVRAPRSGALLAGVLIGGMLSQLIEEVADQLGEAEDQLREAVECIEWYERARRKAEGRMARLQQRLEVLRELQAQDQEMAEGADTEVKTETEIEE